MGSPYRPDTFHGPRAEASTVRPAPRTLTRHGRDAGPSGRPGPGLALVGSARRRPGPAAAGGGGGAAVPVPAAGAVGAARRPADHGRPARVRWIDAGARARAARRRRRPRGAAEPAGSGAGSGDRRERRRTARPRALHSAPGPR